MHPDFERAARLLVEVAGPGAEHIEMSRPGEVLHGLPRCHL
jgi:hypothetical protein